MGDSPFKRDSSIDQLWDAACKEMTKMVHFTECLFHGNTTGLDYKTILMNRPLLINEEGEMNEYTIHEDYKILGISTGIRKLTKKGVTKIKSLIRETGLTE